MPDHFYVYPAYLQKGLTRADGRRVTAEEALTELTPEEIVDAAKKLGAKAVVESDKHYPRRFFDYGGRVKVTKAPGRAKSAFLRAVAAEIRRQRATALKR